MDLSAHITLDQLTHSSMALRKGIENVPGAGEIANLQRLCEVLLEPALALLGVSVHYDSGYRSPALNQAVGGATGSAHMDGRAADLVPTGLTVAEAFEALRTSSLPYDQIILECGAWIHLAVAKVGMDPRLEALKATGGPGAWKYVQVPA